MSAIRNRVITNGGNFQGDLYHVVLVFYLLCFPLQRVRVSFLSGYISR